MDRETKICVIVNRLIQGYTDREIMEELGIKRRTYFYWKKRIYEEGHASVMVKKQPGTKPECTIAGELREKILYWRDRYGWGPGKIAGHLRVHYGIHISHHQVYRLLCETGRNKPVNKPRRTWGRKMYERRHSMNLLHADWKDVRSKPMLTYLDDHSRFVLASMIFSEATAENSIRLLEQVMRRFSMPEQILTDRGTQFFNNREGLSAFTQFCIDNGIKHIRCSKGHPQANGKLEAFHSCYDAESHRFSTHNRFVRYWNCRRPHGGIGYKYPEEVFYKDMKSATNSG